jgi:hypothetical protein
MLPFNASNYTICSLGYEGPLNSLAVGYREKCQETQSRDNENKIINADIFYKKD